jgi:hypothetical protein
MKILKIYFHYLRNEAHYQFLLLVQKLFSNYPQVASIVSTLLPRLNELIAIEGKIVDAMKSSIYTEQLVEIDGRIDRDIAGIEAAIESALHHYTAAFVDAAKVLKLRFEAFHGDIEKKAYEEESAAVKILVADLKTTYASQVSQLSLGGWVSELEAAQTEFERVFLLRNKELAARPQEQLRDVRKEEDGIYHNIVERIDAYGSLNGYSVTGQFVRELNREVAYFNEHNHRPARKSIGTTNVEEIPVQLWSGEPVTPLPVVTDAEGEKLVFSRDYEVTYRKNNAPGTATLIIHGKGAWKNRRPITFNIVAVNG